MLSSYCSFVAQPDVFVKQRRYLQRVGTIAYWRTPASRTGVAGKPGLLYSEGAARIQGCVIAETVRLGRTGVTAGNGNACGSRVVPRKPRF